MKRKVLGIVLLVSLLFSSLPAQGSGTVTAQEEEENPIIKILRATAENLTNWPDQSPLPYKSGVNSINYSIVGPKGRFQVPVPGYPDIVIVADYAPKITIMVFPSGAWALGHHIEHRNYAFAQPYIVEAEQRPKGGFTGGYVKLAIPRVEEFQVGETIIEIPYTTYVWERWWVCGSYLMALYDERPNRPERRISGWAEVLFTKAQECDLCQVLVDVQVDKAPVFTPGEVSISASVTLGGETLREATVWGTLEKPDGQPVELGEFEFDEADSEYKLKEPYCLKESDPWGDYYVIVRAEWGKKKGVGAASFFIMGKLHVYVIPDREFYEPSAIVELAVRVTSDEGPVEGADLWGTLQRLDEGGNPIGEPIDLPYFERDVGEEGKYKCRYRLEESISLEEYLVQVEATVSKMVPVGPGMWAGVAQQKGIGLTKIFVTQYSVSLEASPDKLPADGESQSTIRCTVTDPVGPVKGHSVDFTLSDPDLGRIDPESATTGDDGVAEAIFTAGKSVGIVTITAKGSASEQVNIVLTGLELEVQLGSQNRAHYKNQDGKEAPVFQRGVEDVGFVVKNLDKVPQGYKLIVEIRAPFESVYRSVAELEVSENPETKKLGCNWNWTSPEWGDRNNKDQIPVGVYSATAKLMDDSKMITQSQPAIFYVIFDYPGGFDFYLEPNSAAYEKGLYTVTRRSRGYKLHVEYWKVWEPALRHINGESDVVEAAERLTYLAARRITYRWLRGLWRCWDVRTLVDSSRPKGICRDFAALLIAYSRAVGIPARSIHGWGGGGHVWTELYCRGWKTHEPTWILNLGREVNNRRFRPIVLGASEDAGCPLTFISPSIPYSRYPLYHIGMSLDPDLHHGTVTINNTGEIDFDGSIGAQFSSCDHNRDGILEFDERNHGLQLDVICRKKAWWLPAALGQEITDTKRISPRPELGRGGSYIVDDIEVPTEPGYYRCRFCLYYLPNTNRTDVKTLITKVERVYTHHSSIFPSSEDALYASSDSNSAFWDISPILMVDSESIRLKDSTTLYTDVADNMTFLREEFVDPEDIPVAVTREENMSDNLAKDKYLIQNRDEVNRTYILEIPYISEGDTVYIPGYGAITSDTSIGEIADYVAIYEHGATPDVPEGDVVMFVFSRNATITNVCFDDSFGTRFAKVMVKWEKELNPGCTTEFFMYGNKTVGVSSFDESYESLVDNLQKNGNTFLTMTVSVADKFNFDEILPIKVTVENSGVNSEDVTLSLNITKDEWIQEQQIPVGFIREVWSEERDSTIAPESAKGATFFAGCVEMSLQGRWDIAIDTNKDTGGKGWAEVQDAFDLDTTKDITVEQYQEFEFEAIITNRWDTTLHGVDASINLFHCFDTSDPVEQQIGDLLPKEKRTISWQLKATSSGELPIEVSVTSDDGGYEAATTTLTSLSQPYLYMPNVITKTDAPEAGKSKTISIDVTIQNLGDLTANNVQVKLVLPGDITSTTLTHDIGDLLGGEEKDVSIDITFNKQGDFAFDVVAEDDADHSTTATMSVFLLTTLPNPPNMPSNASPRDGDIDVPVDADLSWTGGDPDPQDIVTYDIYFGTSSPPPLKETIGPYGATKSFITYDLEPLEYDTTYYWRIIATDNHGESAEGPIWNFTTAGEWDPWVYDENNSNYIEIGELLQAINDYIGGKITISQLLQLINLYISHTAKP